jgi:hypothetical protein
VTTLEIANPATLAVDKMLLIANPATLAVDDMQLECDPSLMVLGDGGKSILLLKQILLDNGSNQCILNHFYRLLYISLNNLIGKSGAVDQTIAYLGSVSFMIRTLEKVYCFIDLSKWLFLKCSGLELSL